MANPEELGSRIEFTFYGLLIHLYQILMVLF